jgi:hypothetical protein
MSHVLTWNLTCASALKGQPIIALAVAQSINSLKAELNPICHLLVLLGDLTFMVPCILSIFQYTFIANKMQNYTVYLYLETALHVSGGTCAHHQERIQLYLQPSRSWFRASSFIKLNKNQLDAPLF